MNTFRRQFSAKLLADPSLPSTLSKAKKEIHLKLENGSNFYLTTDLGHKISLSGNPQLNSLAAAVHQMQNINHLSSLNPEESLSQLHDCVASNPQLGADWVLRNSLGFIA